MPIYPKISICSEKNSAPTIVATTGSIDAITDAVDERMFFKARVYVRYGSTQDSIANKMQVHISPLSVFTMFIIGFTSVTSKTEREENIKV